MAHNNKTYAIVAIAELNNVDYSQVEQTSADTVRKSVAEDLFIVKWVGITPASISALTAIPVEYTHQEILAEVAKVEWTPAEI